jgi:acyl-CoA synthetase (NDP forming)
VEGWLEKGPPTQDQTAELLDCYGITVTQGPSEGVPTRIVALEDPSFGAVISFGLSDETAALLDDRAYRLAPLTDVEAAELVRAIRTAPLLLGHRGADPVDVASLEELLQRVAKLAHDLPEVAKLVLDPVQVSPSGIAVQDVTLRLERPLGPRPELGPRRLP